VRPEASPPSDAEGRALIATALDETLVVEAAAGTGKTTELVERIVRVLAAGRAAVHEVVAVTFTEKAAGELKLRLRERLEVCRQEATDADVVARLFAAVQRLEEAHVSTIHGFCADLLRERPVEARVDPLFRVLTEAEAERLFGEAFDAWFQGVIEDPPEGVRRSLRRSSRPGRPGESDEDGQVERLRRAAYELSQWRDFGAAWTRPDFDRGGSAIEAAGLLHALAALSANASYAGDNLFVDTAPVRRLSQALRAEAALRSASATPSGRDELDDLEARLVDLRRNRDFRRARKGSGPTYARGVTRAQVLTARDALMLALDEFQVRADEDLAALLRADLLACLERYEDLKRREGALDFLDLLLRARALVHDDRSVRTHFQSRFKRIFVDEFQDTDPLQAELLLLLSSDDPDETRWEHVRPIPGKLFIVGDPKQSIYRFRRADVDVYGRVSRQLHESGAREIQLRQSYRAVPALQRFINAAFAPIMDGDAESLQARYVALEPARADHAQQPAVVALPVPRPYGQRFVSAREIEASLPDAVGAYVDWLVRESGWTVTERRQPVPVPIQPRHVCLLFRRFVSYGEDITRPYVEALEARGIHHLLVGGKAFHDREEIETLRAALTAIEWPDDQLSVFATLRGALFGIGDEELLEYRHLGGRFHPFHRSEGLPERLAPIGEALELLARLHRARNRVPIAQTVTTLLDETRAHVGFVLRPAGEQALANVLHVAELARSYEISGGTSFRGFVEALHLEATAGAAAEAPILEEGSDGVRLMTVHKAKGLEFPAVILADITARLTPFEAGRHIDASRRLCAIRLGGWSPRELNGRRDLEQRREQREGERLAYVAATRARDLLVVPAVGDEPYLDGWVSPLNAAIYPEEPIRRAPVTPAGCPRFKSRDSVLVRPDAEPARSTTVCPGEHRFGDGDAAHSVVWWSPEPGVLALDAQAPLGLRREDLIVRDVSPVVLRDHLDAYTHWRRSRDAAVAAAAVPTIRLVTATEAAGETGPAPAGASVTVIEAVLEPEATGAAETADDRPGGARFGSLVHALLADVPLADVTVHAVESLARVQGRILGASDREISSAVRLVTGVLRHHVLRDAAAADAAGRCYRETPVTLRRDDGTLVEGTVDLAYDTGREVVVLDFKTDRPDPGSKERYVRQVSLYTAAVGRALDRPARGVLMLL
jgi:ATP-dependent exoDNAse (exonuclease V) beta subunit